MDFSDYSARDFVLNESFQKWVLEPDEETKKVWDDWFHAHPEKSEVVLEAQTMVKNIKDAIEKNIARDRNEVWERIIKDIDKLDDEKEVSERRQDRK